MLIGRIDERFEATLRLVAGNFVGAAERQSIVIDAIVDTGFTGFLSLPLASIQQLGLTYYGSEDGFLGDGNLCTFDMYKGMVIWDGEWRVDINAAETTSLVGMSLLRGYRYQMDTVVGGRVVIESLALLET
jgi:predicted aspartyl protease